MSYAHPQNQRPDMEVYRKPNWLDKILDVNIDSTMKTGAFQTVHEWVKAQTGLEISSLVWAITFLIPAAKYGRESIRWVRDNATSILSIEIRTVAAQDLQAWVNGQPVSSLLAWLPSQESLEIQQPTDTNIPEDEQAHSVYEAASSSGHQFFFFQGIPFILSKIQNNRHFLFLRWGQPLKVVKDLSVFIQERISGKHDFQYDINREPLAGDLELLPVDDDSDLEDELLGKLENTIDKIKKVISTPSATDSESTDATPSSNSSRDSLYAGFFKSSHYMTPQPKQTSLKQVFGGLLAAPTRFQRFVSQKILRVRSSKDADKAIVVESPSPAHPSDTTASSQAGKQLPLMAASLSADNASYPVTADAPDTDGESEVFLTPCSTKTEIEATFQLYRSPSHPDVVGCRNIHPYDGPVDDDDKDGSEGNETRGKDHTVYLRSVAPKPLEDEDVLRVAK